MIVSLRSSTEKPLRLFQKPLKHLKLHRDENRRISDLIYFHHFHSLERSIENRTFLWVLLKFSHEHTKICGSNESLKVFMVKQNKR